MTVYNCRLSIYHTGIRYQVCRSTAVIAIAKGGVNLESSRFNEICTLSGRNILYNMSVYEETYSLGTVQCAVEPT